VIITLWPNREGVRSRLRQDMAEIRQDLTGNISRIANIPESDILVHLGLCRYDDTDPKATDLEVEMRTCPGKSETIASGIVDVISERLAWYHYTASPGAEIWLQFIPGEWAHVVGTKTIDRVEHNPGTRYYRSRSKS
jgi:hypothetical protein